MVRLGAERPLAFFAGLWTEWTSTRKKSEGEVTADLFGLLTCEPSEPVASIHPKAMPVALKEPDELEAWMTASWDEAKAFQRPLREGALLIVAQGERKDI